MASNSTSEYKVIADKIVSPDEDIIIQVVGDIYKDSIDENNRLATIGDIGTASLPQGLDTTDSPTFSKVLLTNGGAGEDVKIGDDAWIGDVNIANHLGIKGVQNSTNAGIVLGGASTSTISKSGSNLSITSAGDLSLNASGGNMQFLMDGGLYIGNVDSNNQIIKRSDISNLPQKVSVPSTASSVGTTGQMAWDASYLYVCVATNTWKRVAVSTW